MARGFHFIRVVAIRDGVVSKTFDPKRRGSLSVDIWARSPPSRGDTRYNDSRRTRAWNVRETARRLQVLSGLDKQRAGAGVRGAMGGSWFGRSLGRPL